MSELKANILVDLLGQVMVKVEQCTTGWDNGDCLEFTFEDGRVFMFYHAQDCCERVEIESIVGDLNDLVGAPLLMAEEVIKEGTVDDWETETWTFYKFATRKGYVDVRWLGSSNGYYSETVDYRWKS